MRRLRDREAQQSNPAADRAGGERASCQTPTSNVQQQQPTEAPGHQHRFGTFEDGLVQEQQHWREQQAPSTAERSGVLGVLTLRQRRR